LPARWRREILAADVTRTLADVLRVHAGDRIELDVDDPGILRDVDTPDDLAARTT
jgi:hypothetical protein